MGIRRRVIASLLGVFFVVACSPVELPNAVDPAVAETISLGGSGAAYPAVRALADAYAKAHAEVRFDFHASSTTNNGLQTMRAGSIDVAVLGRGPTAEETLDKTVRFIGVAGDAVAVVVNPSVGLLDLSTSQLRDLYSGKILTWRELEVTGGAVTLLDRPEDETAKIALRLMLGADLVIDSSAVQLSKESDMMMAVRSTAGAVGFFSASLLTATPSIGRAIRIDGVAPDVAAIRAGTYPAVRRIAIAISPSSADRSSLAGFLSYLSSREAADLLTAAGFAPLP